MSDTPTPKDAADKTPEPDPKPAADETPEPDRKPAPREQSRAGKKAAPSFLELLGREMTWDNVKELMTYEIVPTHRRRKELTEIAIEKGWVTAADIERLETTGELNDALGEMMVERGMIGEDQLAEARALQATTGQPLWRAVLQTTMAQAEEVKDFLNTPIPLLFAQRPDTEYCRWFVREGKITQEELEEAWRQAHSHKVDLTEYLLDHEMITGDDVGRARASEACVPYDDLAEVTSIPARLVRMIPPPLLLRHQALPYKIEDNVLYVAFPDGRQIRELEHLGLMLECDLQPVIAPKARLEQLQREYLPDEMDALALGEGEELEALERSGKVMPAVELMTVILRGLMKSKGTDIHIEPQKESTRIRYRIDGQLHDVLTVDKVTGRKIVTRMKSLSGMDVSQPFLPHDGHLAVQVGDQRRDFRMASIPGIYGEKLALRLVQSEMAFSNFRHIGMTAAQEQQFNHILNLPSGLVVTAGPVGSGKTTTLYAAINVLDCFTHNIMTVEDPVEFEVAGINQVQTHEKRGLTFAEGLRAILRQDPDIIMVGEIRDEETAQIALRAAMTGTLVLSTLHARSAPTAITSFLHLGARPYLVANALTAVVFQRLVRLVCPHCREEFEPKESTIRELKLPHDRPLKLSRGTGCKECLHTGYQGRIGVFEVLTVDENFREIITRSPSHDQLQQAAIAGGMRPLREQVLDMVLEGKTTVEEMYRVVWG